MVKSAEKSDNSIVSAESIESRIFLIRGRDVMIDADLADLYNVRTKVLVQAVKRNISRFPDDFMFILSKDEFANLRSQFVTSNRGGRRYLPYVFTEQGVAMLSSILNSERAIQVNIAIMRAFVKIRQMIAFNKDLAQKLSEIEHKLGQHDQDIISLFGAITKIMRDESKPKNKFGFV